MSGREGEKEKRKAFSEEQRGIEKGKCIAYYKNDHCGWKTVLGGMWQEIIPVF